MKISDTKMRILALERIFLNATHKLTLPEIQEKLRGQYGITVERKSLYDDIAALTYFWNIKTEKSNSKFFYYLQK